MFKGSQDRSIAQSGAPVIRIDYAQQTEARSKRARGITPVEQSAFKPILADQMGAAEKASISSRKGAAYLMMTSTWTIARLNTTT